MMPLPYLHRLLPAIRNARLARWRYGDVGTRWRALAFWLAVAAMGAAGAVLGSAVAQHPAVGSGAAVLLFSAVTATAAMARYGFSVSRTRCRWIAWAAFAAWTTALKRLLLQPDDNSALNVGTVSIVLLLMLIVTLVVCLDARSGYRHHAGDRGGSPD